MTTGVAYKQIKEKGEIEAIVAMVRKGWEKNYPITEIADLAGISMEEVKKLITEFENENKSNPNKWY